MPQTHRTDSGRDDSGERLTRLAAGELNAFAAWRLRRRIARDPALNREWEEVRRLWAGLAELGALDAAQPAGVRPNWPLAETISTKRPDVIRVGGLNRNRRLAFVALTASLCTVTGAFAAHEMGYNPFSDFSDRGGNVWKATPHFRGEVRFYDMSGKSLGSEGTDSSGAPGDISADVSFNGTTELLHGAGRHPFSARSGAVVGYVDLVPETAEQRAAGWVSHEKAMGHEAQLKISSGDMDGFGIARGFFGDSPRLSWTLRGVAIARFRLASNGKIVRSGIAGPLHEGQRAALRAQLGPRQYAAQVADRVPVVPTLSWSVDGGPATQWQGFGTHDLTLPDGTRLLADLLPNPKAAAPESNRKHNDHGK